MVLNGRLQVEMENDLPNMIGANTTILFDFVRTPKSRKPVSNPENQRIQPVRFTCVAWLTMRPGSVASEEGNSVMAALITFRCTNLAGKAR